MMSQDIPPRLDQRWPHDPVIDQRWPHDPVIDQRWPHDPVIDQRWPHDPVIDQRWPHDPVIDQRWPHDPVIDQRWPHHPVIDQRWPHDPVICGSVCHIHVTTQSSVDQCVTSRPRPSHLWISVSHPDHDPVICGSVCHIQTTTQLSMNQCVTSISRPSSLWISVSHPYHDPVLYGSVCHIHITTQFSVDQCVTSRPRRELRSVLQQQFDKLAASLYIVLWMTNYIWDLWRWTIIRWQDNGRSWSLVIWSEWSVSAQLPATYYTSINHTYRPCDSIPEDCSRVLARSMYGNVSTWKRIANSNYLEILFCYMGNSLSGWISILWHTDLCCDRCLNVLSYYSELLYVPGGRQ